MKLRFVLNKETKGAVRYHEMGEGGTEVTGDDAFIGALYIRKANLGKVSGEYASNGTFPRYIEVTLESE